MADRALYAYTTVSIETLSLDERALYAYTTVSIESLSVDGRALYGYTEVGIEPLSVALRGLYNYTYVVPRVNETTPVEFQLLDANWQIERILRAK